MSAGMPPLIPREALLGNARRANPLLSPYGTRITYLAPDDRDVTQVWIRTIGANDDRCVSSARRSIQDHEWACDSLTILYRQDDDGDENYHLCAIDVQSETTRDLIPWRGVRCHYTLTRPSRPHEIVAALNVRDRNALDAWRIDLRTGAATLCAENPGGFSWWLADDDLAVRGLRAYTDDGGFEVRVRATDDAPWRTLVRTAPEEWIFPFDFSKDGRRIFLLSSVGNDTIRVLERDIGSDREREVAAMDGFDAERVMIHPVRREIEAVAFEPARRKWVVVDPAIGADFDAVRELDDGDFHIVSRDLADRKWIVEFRSAHRSTRYLLWDRAQRKASFLFSQRPELDALQLAEVRPMKYRARDGLEVHCYLAIPPGLEPRHLPLVIGVHGGPMQRDYWALNQWTQFFCNRGYAVLQPNFRGSMGYGMRHLHAGDRQWGREMQDDLTDAVNWADAQGIADPKRVTIFGLSYGGYAALAGAVFTPDVYKCAIDVCGQSNLFTAVSSFPAYWGMRAIWNARVGNPDDPADQELLRNASPLFAADKIRISLLIAQGAEDPRVPQSESEQIVAAI
jgi:dipeptidyl aminopeptidase/acylaminoacyl peptidase